MSAKKKKKETTFLAPGVERAFSIIELLSQHQNGLTLSQIVEYLNIPRNSVFRITLTLEELGYLHKEKESKRFILTPKLLSVGYNAVSEVNILELSLDILRNLRDKTMETVLLCTLVENEGIIINEVLGLHPFKYIVQVGSRVSLHSAAPGKAILAYLPEKELDVVLNTMKFEKHTANTIENKNQLCEELNTIRERKYVIDCEETLNGVNCVGAPILDHNNYPVAAISVTAPVNRLPKNKFEKWGKLVYEHAQIISSRLGNHK